MIQFKLLQKYMWKKNFIKNILVMYRAGNSNNAYGRWFTSEPPASVVNVRIDTAVKQQWINKSTGELTGISIVDTVYAIKIPRGEL